MPITQGSNPEIADFVLVCAGSSSGRVYFDLYADGEPAGTAVFKTPVDFKAGEILYLNE